MRKTISCVLAFLLLLGLLPRLEGVSAEIVQTNSLEASNLFVNGGFEQTSSASGWSGNISPTGWTRFVFSGSPVYSVDTSEFHSGTSSVRLEASSLSRGT